MSNMSSMDMEKVLCTMPIEKFYELRRKFGYEFNIDADNKQIEMFLGDYCDINSNTCGVVAD